MPASAPSVSSSAGPTARVARTNAEPGRSGTSSADTAPPLAKALPPTMTATDPRRVPRPIGACGSKGIGVSLTL